MRRNRPTLEEAKRAIYLDFEGCADEAPTVLGTLWVPRRGQQPMLRQYVLEPALRTIAVAPLASASLAGELRSLLGRAARQHRVLIGWSDHELDVVRTHCPELARAFEAVYRDAKVVAKAWGRERGIVPRKDARKRKHRLAVYEAAVGLTRPDELGPKDMAKAIRGARKAMARGAEPMNGSAGRRWERMLVHNELDLRATREVTLRALDELRPSADPSREKDETTAAPPTVDALLLAGSID